MSWSDVCGNCNSHRADCDCGNWSIVRTKGKKVLDMNRINYIVKSNLTNLTSGNQLHELSPSGKKQLEEYIKFIYE